MPSAFAHQMLRRIVSAAAPLLLTLVLPAALPVQAQTPTTATTATSKPANPLAPFVSAEPLKVVIKVNGAPITRGDIDQLANRMLAQQSRMFAGGNMDMEVEQIEMLRNQARKQARQGAIQQKLVEQAKAKAAIKVEPKDIEDQKQRLKGMLAQQGMDYDRFLAMQSMTDEEVNSRLSEQIETEKMIEARAGKLTPTDEELRAFYEKNLDRMKEPEQVRASHILLGFPGNPRDPDYKPSDKDKADAKAKAEAALGRVKAGEDFAAIAKELSSCPSAKEGGDLGLFPKGQMTKAFEDAAFGLKPGEVSGVVETEFGYHIIKVTEHKQEGVQPFEAVSDQLKEYMTEQKFNEAMETLIKEEMGKAKIEELEPVEATAPQIPNADSTASQNLK